MWQNYFNASTIEEALQVLHEHPERSRIIAGGTDLILEMERGSQEKYRYSHRYHTYSWIRSNFLG